MNRRHFVYSSAAAGLTVAVAPRALFAESPTIMNSKSVKPVVIASANGNKFKNGGDMTCVQKAFTMMTHEDADVLDALIAGVNIVELDPLDTSVGYGGLPNADGIVQLDSCCMHGPKKRAGGVAAIEGVRTPSLVAKAAMEQTDHHSSWAPGRRILRAVRDSRSRTTSIPRSRANYGSNGRGGSIRRITSIRKSALRPAVAP